MNIRPASVSDLPAMAGIVADAYREHIGRIGKAPGPMLADDLSHVRRHVVRVIDHDGETPGLIVSLPGSDHLLLDDVAVAPARHGCGIGRALMALAEKEATRRGYAELRLHAHETMTENPAMHLAPGWEETGRGEQAGHRRAFFRKRA